MENLPITIKLGFIITTIVTFFLFYRIVKKSNGKSHLTNKICIGMFIWLLLQFLLSTTGFYIENTKLIPPPFLLAFVPTLLFILFIFLTKKGREFVDSLPIIDITYLHIVRIPVELILYGLAIYQTIPELMTFAGRNFDIIAGISAPFIAYYGLKKHLINNNIILAWNIISLGLLLFIIASAILSAPFTFQQFAFEQPNIAVFYFPYVWLPSFIVPIVLFCHLVSIRVLTIKQHLLTGLS